jgi:RNA-directed DNA polymerase
VNAKLKNNSDEIYKLQRELVCSFAGRALAIRKVVTNSGSKTAGLDKIKWNGAEDYWKAIQQLKTITRNPKLYKATALLRVYIPKGNTGEMRPLGIPTLIDRAVQAVYHLAVDPVVEVTSDGNSFGFRKHRSTHDAITAIRSLMDKQHHPHWILDADIARCFDKINHEFLMKHTPICDKNVLEQWLKSGVVDKGILLMTEEGTPQGGIISPTLCNIALNGIESFIKRLYPLKKGISPGIHVIRYADDMVITGKSPDILQDIKESLKDFLKERGLEFNEKKTKIVNIKGGFDFLGFNISRKEWNPRLNQDTSQKTVLIIKPSEKGIKKLKNSIKERIVINAPIERIIANLNPILRGWGEHKRISYHSQEVFISIDHYIYGKMVKWAAKHGGSLKAVIANNTLETDNRKWNWGKSLTEKLINLAEIPIISIKPLKQKKNPYLTDDKEYFIKRKNYLIWAKFRAAVYKKFNQICPICKDSLHNGENVELHHIEPVKQGGKYKLNNIQPLHQICHQKVTHMKSK